MLERIIKKINNKLSNETEKKDANYFSVSSYSQAGEDSTLFHIFAGKNNGYYIDIGAYDPQRMSNTMLFHHFYNWKGINVDANPTCIEEFNKYRPSDINLNFGISNEEGIKQFYIFNKSGHDMENTMNSFLGEKYDKDPTNVIDVHVKKIETILDESLPKGQEIDILNLDVEGLELEALKSNNWDKYRPKVMIIECVDTFVRNTSTKEIVEYAESKGYTGLFKLPLSTIFVRSDIELNDINQIID
jgi:FkbM family methyltransferase